MGTIMKYGYARVSKNEQSLEIQIQKLKTAGCDKIFMEKISGINDERPQLKNLMKKLHKGDTVCVVRLDRLGRRMIRLVELINNFRENEIEFISLENNIDTSTPMGMLLFSMCAAFSEMERELIRDRVKAGIESARKKGKRIGRPQSITNKKASMLNKLQGTLPVSKICTILGISRSVYYRYLRSSVVPK